MSTIKATTLSNLAGSQTVPVDTVAQGSAKAWVNFNGTGTVAIRRAFNVSSITDNGTGDYTVNFTTAMPDANYAVSGVTQFGASSQNPRVVVIPAHLAVPTTSAARICTRAGNATSGTGDDCDYVYVAIFS